MITKKVLITGIVQGVGFRPFVYNLAQKFGLKGCVKNINSNVSILIQHKNVAKMADFINEIKRNPPRNAIISKVRIRTQKCKKNYKNFVIIDSKKNHNADFYSAIPRDLALCDECEKELKNSRNRRFGYSFINCINCGPRWSIIESLPYDRERTAMKDFQMCESCEREYRNVKNRRFHAQPNSCGQCGIKMSLFDNEGDEIILDSCESSESKKAQDSRAKWVDSPDSQSKIFDFLRTQIKNGKIICLKGIGGFNLICAVESNAIATLRTRKNRPRKPFAIMFRDIQCAKKYFRISKAEERALLSPSAPIVLLSHPKVALPQNLSYNLNTYGVIIAYSALHKLLFKRYSKPLVFTSANLSSESIITQKATAQAKIAHIFDYLVDYNRAIINPIDDSLKRILRGGKVATLRAGRGDYPLLKISKFKSDEVILALGANQKSQIAIFFSSYMLISRYIGDLDNIDSIFAFRREILFLLKLYNLTPSVILCDCHRFYESSKIASALAQKFGAKVARIYHHRAHFYSSLFCNDLAYESQKNILGVVFDGTGLGEDGTIWGGEFFIFGNLFWGMRFRTCENFGESTDSSLVLSPKFSQIQKPHRHYFDCDSLHESAMNQAQNCNISSLRGRITDSPEAIQNKNQIARSATLKASSGAGVGVVREGDGSDFAIRKNPCIQAPTPSLKENAHSQKGEFNADLFAESCKEIDSNLLLDSRDLDCHENSLRSFSRNDDNFLDSSLTAFAHNDKSFVNCHENPADFLAMTGRESSLQDSLNYAPFSSLRGRIVDSPEAIQKNKMDCHESLRDSRNDEMLQNSHKSHFAKPYRIAHFATFPLLGGESAIKDISKIALGILFSVYGRAIPLESKFKNIDLLYQMQQKGINSPQTSSVGRIFDFVAFMCGLESQSFEGESGGYVESLYNPQIQAHYGVEICNGEISLQKIVRGIVGDYKADSRESRTIIATKFINTLAKIITHIALETRANRPNLKVIFSGGVFANKILCDKITSEFRAHKIAHHFHTEIPTNDGGIAVGQIIAYLRGDFENDFENGDIKESEN